MLDINFQWLNKIQTDRQTDNRTDNRTEQSKNRQEDARHQHSMTKYRKNTERQNDKTKTDRKMLDINNNINFQRLMLFWIYSQTCLQRPPLGPPKSGHCSKVKA